MTTDNKVLKEFKPIQKTDDTQIRVSLKEYKESQYLDIRQYWKPEDKEEYLPTKSGVTLSVNDTLDEIEELYNQIGLILKELGEED